MQHQNGLSRRAALLGVAFSGIGTAALAQTGPVTREPPSTVTLPPRDFGPNARRRPISPIRTSSSSTPASRITCSEQRHQAVVDRRALGRGPAWSAEGRYLVWSDIPNNRQMRWIEETGGVSVFRQPSNNSNSNTFDFQGRQITCEHLGRWVVRYEHDGTVTILADSYQGKRLNSPNDAAPHPDGSIWFTDPPYGGQLYEGTTLTMAAAPTRGSANPQATNRGAGSCRPTYIAWNPSGRLDLVITEIRCRTRTGSASAPTTSGSICAAPARDPVIKGPGGEGDLWVGDIAGLRVETSGASATA